MQLINLKKAFFELMINRVFSKTMENVRKRVTDELINNGKDYVRCVSRPSFISQKIFSKSLVAFHRIKPVLTLNKPIYLGFSILELSKSLMCDFHYKYFKNKFMVGCCLLIQAA